jgi:hypothetical protein
LGVVAVGAFLLTGAAMLRWYAAPRAALVPLDPAVTVTLTGTGAAYDIGLGGPRTGPLTERVAVRGGGVATGVVIWAVNRRLAGPDGVPLRVADERVSLDRRTAVAVACCGDRPGHTGLTYLFPAGLARADQQVYDPTTGRAAPARYAGADVVAGLRVYRFEQSVPETDLRTGALPGAPPLPAPPATAPPATAPPATGPPATAPPATAPPATPPPATAPPAATTGELLAASQRTLWVEPVSGVVVQAAEHRQERLVPASGPAVQLLDARLRTDPGSVRRLAGLAADRRGRLLALRRTAPLGLTVVGSVLLIAGLCYRIVTMQAETRP